MVNSQIGTLVVKLAMDASAFGKGISDAQSKLASAGQNMQALGGKLTAGLTLPLIGAGTAAIAFATDYNAALANVQSLGLPIDRINEFKNAIQDMAVDVGKAPRDLAEGMYQVISAFGDSGDSLAILEINAKAAAAGLASTTEAINLTSAVTKGYGDTTAEAVQKACRPGIRDCEARPNDISRTGCVHRPGRAAGSVAESQPGGTVWRDGDRDRRHRHGLTGCDATARRAAIADGTDQRHDRTPGLDGLRVWTGDA